MFNLKVIESVFLWKDFFQQRAQFGYIPLPVAKVIDPVSDNFLCFDLEYIIESPVCVEHPQIRIQHYKGVTDCLNNIFIKLNTLF